MKPRMEPLAAVTGKPGFLVVDVPGKGPHQFRLPSWSRAQRVAEFVRDREGGARTIGIEAGAVTVAGAWRHEMLEIEAQWPDDPSTAAMARYAEEVQLELEAQGYTYADVDLMASAVVAALRARTEASAAAQAEAKKAAGFSAPPQGSPTS